ncbi:sensor histidine kinase [Rubripirellula reticaptiva]|uniref:histidine kinase n=1 Tax=Rubripirellula reticaptiva TaxID=2528013 RepID=A0A5C6FBK2_9BACT|nr:HAMP domain-containing sensor histidine kinase [Rubripirellula reticaptiva]TWU58172.1 Sensor protein FixL [Rubripirellula reticaptiva]
MPTPSPFRSLRLRILAPLIATAVLAAGLVSIASYRLGTHWATVELQARFAGIERSLSVANFPLNSMVLGSLAELTQTELIGLDANGKVRASTIEVTSTSITAMRPLASDLESLSPVSVTLAGRRYRVFSFSVNGSPDRQDWVAEVVVLFDEQRFSDSRRRTAMLPLLTGLSTIAALTSITLWLSSRLVRRIGNLQERVEGVAAGDFESVVSDDVDDEIGRLGGAVDSMASQLSQLWKQVHRQESQKLLHQVASGMAHQLRNSLTGARMAIELHAMSCTDDDDEGIQVAIQQLERSEDYVRRLLLVASGRQDEDRPTDVRVCFEDVQSSLAPMAKHLNVTVQWQSNESITLGQVKDGPAWVAAATNLVHNAIQAGDEVVVRLDHVDPSNVRLTVTDNGPGVEPSIADELFEPFVTSKPEGMGLGLPLVRRAAEHLGGEVKWWRIDQQTTFQFEVPVTRADVGSHTIGSES